MDELLIIVLRKIQFFFALSVTFLFLRIIKIKITSSKMLIYTLFLSKKQGHTLGTCDYLPTNTIAT